MNATEGPAADRFAVNRAPVRDGLEVAYVREGEGFPLVLLHGWPETKRIWWRNIEPLARAGFEVIGSNDTGGLDPTVALLDSTGAQIDFNDDGDPSDIGDSLLEVRLDQGETYTIAVAGFGSTTGDYEIVIS